MTLREKDGTAMITGSPSKALQIIPGVGPSLAQDLVDLGFLGVAELKGQDPEKMYQDLCAIRGVRIDPCVLYVFRCAVYYASHMVHDPDLLKWWNWKDNKGLKPGRPLNRLK